MKTYYLVKRVKTGNYMSHLFEDNVEIAFTGTSKVDSYAYENVYVAKALVNVETKKHCEKFELVEVLTLKQSLHSNYSYEQAVSLANRFTKRHKAYFTALEYSKDNWMVTNKFDPRVGSDNEQIYNYCS